jgi:hypothetical protein
MKDFLLVAVADRCGACPLEPTVLKKRTVSIDVKSVIKSGKVFYEFGMRFGAFLFI